MAVDVGGDLLTLQEAAAQLKMSVVTIKRYVKQGRLQAYHVGPRAVRVKRDDLARVLAPVARANVPATESPITFTPPTEEELAQRRAVIETILANREKRRIAPLTTADLVHLAREDSTWYDGSE